MNHGTNVINISSSGAIVPVDETIVPFDNPDDLFEWNLRIPLCNELKLMTVVPHHVIDACEIQILSTNLHPDLREVRLKFTTDDGNTIYASADCNPNNEMHDAAVRLRCAVSRINLLSLLE